MADRKIEYAQTPQDVRRRGQHHSAFVPYVIFVVLLAGFILLVGPVTQRAFSHDFFAIIEGGWKIVQGYHIYTDFHTLIGPLPYLIVALGILLVGPVADAMPVAIAVTLIPVAALAWYLLSRRFTPLGTFCCAGYLSLLWCAPYPLHFPFFTDSYAMIYNRQAYVLLCLLFLSSAIRPRENLYLKGFLLGLLFYFKIPYCVAGAGFLGFYLLFSGISLREGLGIAAGFLTSFLPVFLYLRPQATWDMFLFMVAAASCRTPDVFALNVGLFWKEFPYAISLVLLLALCSRWTSCRCNTSLPVLPLRWIERAELFGEPLIVLFLSFITEMASCPLIRVVDIPLVCVYALLILERVRHVLKSSACGARVWLFLPSLIPALVLIVPMGLRAIASVAVIVCLKWTPPLYVADTRISGPGIRDMQTFDRCLNYPAGVFYADKVNDGITLIRKHPELDHCAVATLDFSDPFSFSLQRHSPPHMPLGLQYGFDVTEKIAPDPERIFEGCQAIMIPKYADDPARTIAILRSRYDDFLKHNFVVIDQSSAWTLMKRSDSPP